MGSGASTHGGGHRSASLPLTTATHSKRWTTKGHGTDAELLAEVDRLRKELKAARSKITSLKATQSEITEKNAALVRDNTALRSSIRDHQLQIDKLRCLAEQHRVSTSLATPLSVSPRVSGVSRRSDATDVCDTDSHGGDSPAGSPTATDRLPEAGTYTALTSSALKQSQPAQQQQQQQNGTGMRLSTIMEEDSASETAANTTEPGTPAATTGVRPTVVLTTTTTAAATSSSSLARQTDPTTAAGGGGLGEEAPADSDDDGGDSPVNPRHQQRAVAANSSHHRIAVSAPQFHEADMLRTSLAHVTEHKDDETLEQIMGALGRNPFTSKFSLRQRAAIAKAMVSRAVAKDEVVIRQGEEGDSLFVTGSGEYDVWQGGARMERAALGPNTVIGEMAILYKCKRTATVIALQPGRLWCIDLRTFHAVLYKAALDLRAERLAFLGTVPLLRGLAEGYLAKLASAAVDRQYAAGDVVIDASAQPGTCGLNLIVEGEVSVLQPRHGALFPACTLGPGRHFGETTILGTVSATFQASSPTLRVLEIDKLAFDELVVPLGALGTELGSLARELQQARSTAAASAAAYATLKLGDLKRLATLGAGGFGTVELVAMPDGERAALKMVAKEHIVANAQEDHILSEKRVLASLDSPFCLSLLTTFKNDRFCYLLTEACLGGELWSVLKAHGRLDEAATRFYAASVVEAVGYLHSHGIVYRDMKPENILLTSAGYAKLADFGFAKRLAAGEKTWTFCGTPDYMPPEIVMNQGHDFGADIWPIGVLIYELLAGAPPFYSTDSMSTYNRIIVGMSQVTFPRHFSDPAVDIIKALCRECASERLGALHDGFAGIWNHMFFKGFPWQALRGGAVPPPVVPDNAIEMYAEGDVNDNRHTAAFVGPLQWDEEF